MQPALKVSGNERRPHACLWSLIERTGADLDLGVQEGRDSSLEYKLESVDWHSPLSRHDSRLECCLGCCWLCSRCGTQSRLQVPDLPGGGLLICMQNQKYAAASLEKHANDGAKFRYGRRGVDTGFGGR